MKRGDVVIGRGEIDECDEGLLPPWPCQGTEELHRMFDNLARAGVQVGDRGTIIWRPARRRQRKGKEGKREKS